MPTQEQNSVPTTTKNILPARVSTTNASLLAEILSFCIGIIIAVIVIRIKLNNINQKTTQL
jgi:hypothetical protein